MKRMNTKLTEIDRELIDYSIEQRFNPQLKHQREKYIKRLEDLINDCYNDYFNNGA